MREPGVGTPLILSLISSICFVIAFKVKPNEPWSTLFAIAGTILALFAFVTGGDYLLWRLSDNVGRMREAWYRPLLSLASIVQHMTPQHLAYMEMVGPSKVTGRMQGNEVKFYLWTPGGDIPYAWVSDYLERCEQEYPDFIPQHGMADVLERDYVQRFTDLMVHNMFAQRASGNKPARWLIPLGLVYRKLALVDET